MYDSATRLNALGVRIFCRQTGLIYTTIKTKIMQSTTTIVCRALVMVFCLIAIPLAALFGTSLPDIVKALGLGGAVITANDRDKGGEAPLFATNIPDVADAPELAVEHNNVPWKEGNNTMRQAPKVSLDMQTVQAGFTEPAPLYSGQSGSIEGRFATEPLRSERPVVPVAAEATLGGIERFEQIQRQLRDLGATYFRLESFGSDRQFYRFQCEMPIGAAGAVRHFEASSVNSLDAMESVLAEINSWMKN